jgi:hypothetical protein
MELLQQILLRHQTREQQLINKNKLRSNDKVAPKQEHSEMFGLPTYILNKFRTHKLELQPRHEKTINVISTSL